MKIHSPLFIKQSVSAKICGMFLAAFAGINIAGCDSTTPENVDDVVQVEEADPLLENRKAGVGVGVQGSRIRSDDSLASNLVTGSAKAYFDLKEKIVFENHIPQLMSHFEALEGRAPESHEEFMEKIIRPAQVALPKLPEGMRYRYRPELKEIWVESENDPIVEGTPAE